MSDVALIHGDARAVLAELDPGMAQTCVTSPPYWGLRDYGIEPSVWGGDAACDHDWQDASVAARTMYESNDHVRWNHRVNGRGEAQPVDVRLIRNGTQPGATCPACGAWYGGLGLEPSPDLYAEHVVELFDHVARVLRPDGTLWLNLGDCYLPSKSMAGIPWLVAFAMRDAGWTLRAEVIWAKPNPMPESARDRPTKAHEQLFLFSRRQRYYYDADATAEPLTPDAAARALRSSRYDDPETRAAVPYGAARPTVRRDGVPMRNARSVWEIATQPTPDAHFATYPEELVRRCILSTTRKGDTVLDPFVGSGTTALVARRFGRDCIGIDLNPDYLELARRRVADYYKRPYRPDVLDHPALF